MKAYVIKNKEGKYLRGKFDKKGNILFTDDIIDAMPYEEDGWKTLEYPKDCTIVPITIAEGDLEQQLADKEVKIEVLERDIDNLYRTLEEANEEFAEKDKEIEELKANQIPTRKRLLPKNYDKLNIADKLRYKEKQVCIARIRLQEQQKTIDELDYELNKYKQHLAEKVEQIADLHTTINQDAVEIMMLKSALEYNENNIPNQRKAIRYQVCERIRDFAEQTYYEFGVFDESDLVHILDRIERGE